MAGRNHSLATTIPAHITGLPPQKTPVLAYFARIRDLNRLFYPPEWEGDSGLLWHFICKNGLLNREPEGGPYNAAKLQGFILI